MQGRALPLSEGSSDPFPCQHKGSKVLPHMCTSLLRNSCTSRALRAAQAPRWSCLPHPTPLARGWAPGNLRSTQMLLIHRVCSPEHHHSRAKSAPPVTHCHPLSLTVTPAPGWDVATHLSRFCSCTQCSPVPVCTGRESLPAPCSQESTLSVCPSVCPCVQAGTEAAVPLSRLAGMDVGGGAVLAVVVGECKEQRLPAPGSPFSCRAGDEGGTEAQTHLPRSTE